jgi:subtilase family serine protease
MSTELGNSGFGTVDSFFDVFFEITPNVESTTVQVGPVGPQQTIETEIVQLSLSGTVPGSGFAACESGTNWWASSYTYTIRLDPGNAVSECNEGDNQKTLILTPQEE